MIVLSQDENWQIIFQQAHAQLAANIAFEIAPDLRPAHINFSDLHTAIADHDDGRQKWEGRNHLTAEGNPMDYREQPLEMKLRQAKKSIARATKKSPWIGLLTIMHQMHLYAPYEGMPEVHSFLATQAIEKSELLHFLNVGEKESGKIYQFMSFCDELSLILCENRLQDNNQTVIIDPFAQFHDMKIIKANGAYRISPWCFNNKKFNLSVYSSSISKISYHSDKDLINEIDESLPIKLIWKMSDLD